MNHYLPSTSYGKINGVSIHRDQKKEKFSVAFLLKEVTITVLEKLNNYNIYGMFTGC